MTIFVRDLSNEEGNRLPRIARKGADPVEVRRALLILASAQKMKMPKISRLFHISDEHIRKIIHRFNTEGVSNSALIPFCALPLFVMRFSLTELSEKTNGGPVAAKLRYAYTRCDFMQTFLQGGKAKRMVALWLAECMLPCFSATWILSSVSKRTS